MRKFQVPVLLIMLSFAFGCTAITPGATNTTAPNIGVTSYESVGIILTQTFNAEKALLKAGKITASQDSAFQLGAYTKAYNCYQSIGKALNIIFDVKATVADKAGAQAIFQALSAELPGLLTEVQALIAGMK